MLNFGLLGSKVGGGTPIVNPIDFFGDGSCVQYSTMNSLVSAAGEDIVFTKDDMHSILIGTGAQPNSRAFRSGSHQDTRGVEMHLPINPVDHPGDYSVSFLIKGDAATQSLVFDSGTITGEVLTFSFEHTVNYGWAATIGDGSSGGATLYDDTDLMFSNTDWNYVTVSVDTAGGTSSLFFNRQLATSVSGDFISLSGTSLLSFFGSTTNSNSSDNISVDEFRIFNRKLTLEEHTELADASASDDTASPIDYAPSPVTSFVAVGGPGEVNITWDVDAVAYPPARHDLYDSSDTLLFSDVYRDSSYQAIPGTNTYYVKSYNSSGEETSNNSETIVDAGQTEGQPMHFDILVGEGSSPDQTGYSILDYGGIAPSMLNFLILSIFSTYGSAQDEVYIGLGMYGGRVYPGVDELTVTINGSTYSFISDGWNYVITDAALSAYFRANLGGTISAVFENILYDPITE